MLETVSFSILFMHMYASGKYILGQYKICLFFCAHTESLNELGQVELNSHDKSSAIEVEGHQEGKHNY